MLVPLLLHYYFQPNITSRPSTTYSLQRITRMGSAMCSCRLEQPVLRKPRQRNRSRLSNSLDISTSIRTPLTGSANIQVQQASPPQTPHVPVNIPNTSVASHAVRIHGVPPLPTSREQRPLQQQQPQQHRELLVLPQDEVPMLASAQSSLSAGGAAVLRAVDKVDESSDDHCMILVRPNAAMLAAASGAPSGRVDNPLLVSTTGAMRDADGMPTHRGPLLHIVQHHSTESSSRHLSTTSSFADHLDEEPGEQEQNDHQPSLFPPHAEGGGGGGDVAVASVSGGGQWVNSNSRIGASSRPNLDMPGQVPYHDDKSS